MELFENSGYYEIKKQFIDNYKHSKQNNFSPEGLKKMFDRLWREDYMPNKARMLELWKSNKLSKQFEGLTKDQLYIDLENPNWNMLDKEFVELKDIEALKSYVKRLYAETGISKDIIDSYSKKDIILLLETDSYSVTPFACSYWQDQEGYTESYLIGIDL